MLARSTACLHRLGRASANATSISNIRPSRTRRLAGLMSRWAMPVSHSLRMRASPSSMTPSSTSASPSSVESSKNSVTSTYSRSGDSSTKPYGRGDGQAGDVQLEQRVVLLLHQAAYRVEGSFVLEPAVQQFATELVPAVGAQMAAGVQLGEQPLRGHRHATRCAAESTLPSRRARTARSPPRTVRVAPPAPGGSPRHAPRRRPDGRPAHRRISPGTTRSG